MDGRVWTGLACLMTTTIHAGWEHLACPCENGPEKFDFQTLREISCLDEDQLV